MTGIAAFPTLSARDVVEERADLVTWLEDRGEFGGPRAWSIGMAPQDRTLENTSAERWATSLRVAEQFYVSDDLTRTALATGDAFDDFALDITDLPSTHGLVAFGEPITAELHLQSLSGMAITAASWAAHSGLVEIRWWTDKNSWIKDFGATNNFTAQQYRHMHRLHPTKLTAVGHSAIKFGERSKWPTDGIDTMKPPPGASIAELAEFALAQQRLIEAEKTLVAAWLLMGQTLTVETRVQTPRSAAGRIGRLDPALLGAVRQVTLRHKNIAPQQRGNVEGPKREWAHRWCVRGHWRKRRKDARPGTPSKIWITPYIKGPDGAPILDPSKLVNILRR